MEENLLDKKKIVRTVRTKRQKYITWDILSLETISEPLEDVGTSINEL